LSFQESDAINISGYKGIIFPVRVEVDHPNRFIFFWRASGSKEKREIEENVKLRDDCYEIVQPSLFYLELKW